MKKNCYAWMTGGAGSYLSTDDAPKRLRNGLAALLSGIAALLPISIHADTSVHMSVGGQVAGGATYERVQDATNQTVLTEDQQNSAAGTFESINSSASFGSLAASVAASSYQAGGPYPHSSGGSSSAHAEMNAYSMFTLSSPGMAPGSYGHFYVAILVEGDASADDTKPFNYAGGAASYGWSCGVGGVNAGTGANYGGTLNSSSWQNTPVNAIGTVLVSNTFSPGVTLQLGQTLVADAGAGVIPEYSETDRFANGSMRVDARILRIVPMDDQDQPISGSVSSDIGSGRSDVLQPGESLAGLSLTNTAPEELDLSGTLEGFKEALTILQGIAEAFEQATLMFHARKRAAALASHPVDVSGTGTNKIAIQMTYNPAAARMVAGGPGALVQKISGPRTAAQDAAAESAMRLVWYNPASKKFENAVAGNPTGTPTYVKRAYNPATDFQLGRFGVDVTNHTVWAVVNHNSEFAVAAAPVRLAIAKGAGGKTVIDAAGVPRERYMMQATSDLRQPFTDLSAVTAANDGSVHFEDTAPGVQRFYRIAEIEQP